MKNKIKLIYTIALAVITWFAIILQLYLTTGSIINFLSYFTILSNLLIALSLTVPILLPSSKPGVYFSQLPFQTATALYILIVGLVYNTALRGLISLSGWDLAADTLLHVVVPVLYLLYWVIFRPLGTLKWRDCLYWALFPFLYLAYSLLRGSVAHWYPYPFLNADSLGYGKVFLNSIIVTVVFIVAGMVLIAVNGWTKKKSGNHIV